jgi:hypothetical protein
MALTVLQNSIRPAQCEAGMKGIFLLITTVLMLGPSMFWILDWQQPVQAQKPATIDAVFGTLHVAPLARNEALEAGNERTEREIEAERWDSPRQLRELRAIVATELAEDQKQAKELHSDGHFDALDVQTITADRDALARIDARLQLLAAIGAAGTTEARGAGNAGLHQAH